MVTNLSVIMTTYQTGEALKFSVESVLAQKALAELIIVDNGNPEEVLAWLREVEKSHKQVKLITGHGNIGFSAACNKGAAEAQSELLLFLNPDSILSEGSLTAFAEGFAEESIWAVGGRLRNPDGSEQRGARRNLLTPQTATAEMLRLDVALSWNRLNLHEEKLPEEPIEVPAISGACLAIRADKFKELEGFSEDYFLHVEDLDLCRRIHDAGGKILFLPKLDIVHIKGSSNASAFFVEWQKLKGFIEYFRKFENGVMWLIMSALALTNFAAKCLLEGLKRILPEQKSGRRAERRLMWLHRHLREPVKSTKSTLQEKTVLVTGATSQVGICVMGHLLANGAKVVALSHTTKLFFEHPNLTWLEGDLEKSQLDLKNVQADAVIHCAPIWMLERVLSEIFNAKIKRVIAFSSTSVFNKIYSANAGERETVHALERAELMLAERSSKAGASFTVLRPTMIYGLGLDENVTQISDFAQRYHFFPLYPPADGRRMPVHADDLAQIAIKIISNTRTYNKSYNIGGGEVLGYRAMVERIFLALGQRPRTIELKFLPLVLDVLGKWLCGGKVNGEMAHRMNEDMVFLEEETGRDFAFKTRGFLQNGKQDLGQF